MHLSGITNKAAVSAAIFLLLCGMASCASAGGGIQATMGDVIPLSGYSSSGPYVYLYLTGPNLPANGVALDNINRRADEGGFTRVSVDGNDHWEYKWNTANMGNRLDSGTYMIWVVNGPNDRSNLREAEYSTISVSLGNPYVAVDTPSVPAGLDVTSDPAGASVVLDGKYLGQTPFSRSDLAVGTHELAISKFGYARITTPVKLEAGSITTVNAPLVPLVGSLAVNTSPPGATLLLDGSPAGISPVFLANLSAGSHVLNASLDGYDPAGVPVVVAADTVQTVSMNLTPVNRPILPLPTRAAGSVLVPLCSVGILAICSGAVLFPGRRS